jgi:multidrug resistance efflux pump
MARWLPRVRNGVPDTPSNPCRLTADPCNKVTLGASTAAVDSAQARVVKETAELENVRAQTERVFELVKRGVYPAAKADTARAAQDAARAALTGSQADLVKAREELGPKGADNPQLKAALATLERARLNLLYTTVKAPADGLVSNLQLATGQFIGQGRRRLPSST